LRKYLGVVPGTEDEVSFVEHVVVEQQRGDRGDEGLQEQKPGDTRSLLMVRLRAIFARRSLGGLPVDARQQQVLTV
jgi:hypothetical protein